jgi:hypothetical protein
MAETPVELARRLADALEAAGVPYALGGALAFNPYGPPRATKDVDINIFLGASDVGRVCQVPGIGSTRTQPTVVSRDSLERTVGCGAAPKLAQGWIPGL